MPFNPTGVKLLALGLMLVSSLNGLGQDRLKLLPAYERYERMQKESHEALKSGALTVKWAEDGGSFEYAREGKRYRYDIGAKTAVELAPEKGRTNSATAAADNYPSRVNRKRPPAPSRGRQFSFAISPDGLHKAFYRERNLWLSDTNGENEVAITTEGNEKNKIKFGSANWVYGEELYQTTSIWWSSNSQKVAFYRFDESQVPEYYLALNQTNIQDSLYAEPYNKAGGTNPVVDVLVYDLASKNTTTMDVRSGQSCEDAVVGYYVYGVSWSPDSSELIFHRTDRLQKVMELCSADPESGKSRVVIREEWAASWTENSPEMRFLKDGQRFIWASERTGWRNYYLCDFRNCQMVPLTHYEFEVGEIVRLDEEQGCLYYTARSAANPMKVQLHRVGLDGRNSCRLTDPAFHHSVSFAPDGKHFTDVSQTHDTAPATRLADRDGATIAQLATSDLTRFHKLGLRSVELFSFKAADGETDLYGMLHFPSNFQRQKKYPLLVSVYAGPATTGANENFTIPNSLTELGFLVATMDARSASGRGRRFLDSIYGNLGKTEIDDQAAGVKALCKRSYIDARRVGIFGTSYGGTASLLCLMRYADVFRAACACSPVTDFRNYDTIYTERYFGLPELNPQAYEQVSALSYVKQLKGRLMIYYGTADDNVHPSNSLQLIRALQREGKSFEVQVGPDAGHTAVNRERMMEFFVDALR